MPSLKALLFALFFSALAIAAIALFVKKSRPIQDAQVYSEQNPNCNEIKIHSKKNDMVECFLNFESAQNFPIKPEGSDTLYISILKLLGERFPDEFPLRVRYVFSFPDKITDSVGISGNNIYLARGKKPVWQDTKTGCIFPGPCPVMPLNGLAIPKRFAIEDYNTEQIFRDKFMAKGKTPVNAVLPGKILKIEQEHDSLFSVKIYHGQNIYSTTSGLNALKDYVQVGNIISTDSIMGFLPPQDTAFIFLEITRNGKYETWEKFYEESRDKL